MRAMAPEVLAGMREAFERACAAQPTATRVVDLRFAGLPVRLRVVGEGLFEQLDRTFSPLHARGTHEQVELTIDAWDREGTGVGCPGVPFVADATDALGGGLLKQFGDGTVLHFERVRDVAALDRRRRQLLFCVDSARTTELHLRSKPFPDLLATWYRDRGVQPLHAALVARDRRGVLFVGASRSGKSTCALACALSGFDYLGDDAVGLQLAGDQCIGHAFYAGARVDGALVERFPALAAHCIEPIGRWERKGMVFVPELPGCGMAPATPIRAIVVPEISAGNRLQIAVTPPASALRSLAPSSLLVPLGARAVGLTAIAQLVRRTPCFRMTFGDDVRAIPDAVDRMLARLRS
jgi:hypothetical protein